MVLTALRATKHAQRSTVPDRETPTEQQSVLAGVDEPGVLSKPLLAFASMESRGYPRGAVLELLRASLSEKGFTKIRHAMWTNAFLGDLTDKPRVFGEFSYSISLFGELIATTPWGWNLYGHHVAGKRPCRRRADGREPGCSLARSQTSSARGPHRGVQLFQAQWTGSRWSSFAVCRPACVTRLCSSPDKLDPADALKDLGCVWRLVPSAGVFQDNRIIPYEGAPGVCFPDRSRATVMDLAAQFVDHLPDGPLQAQLDRIHTHMDETWFCWIGGTRRGR